MRARRASCSSSRPTCATCSTTTRPSCAGARCAQGVPKRKDGSPVFVLASFQDNKRFFDRTNRVVGKLDFRRRLIARFEKPQTKVWEFR